LFQIDFEPLGKRGQCTSEMSLLDCARQTGIGINSVCGGIGDCQSCKIQIIDGTSSPPTESELKAFSEREIRDGWRLACQSYPTSACKLNIPPESMTTMQRMQTEGIQTKISPDPAVKLFPVNLSSPSMNDQLADADRVIHYLDTSYSIKDALVDIDVLRQLSRHLRAMDWRCKVAIRSNEIIGIIPQTSSRVGLAIDIGSTKIAGYLVNLDDGNTLCSKGIVNPQVSYGEDIISRIQLAMKSVTEAVMLRQLVLDAINGLAADLCQDINIKPWEIIDAAIVGNTVMHHLFLGLPVGQLANAPFIPAISKALDIKARHNGLNLAPGAYIHILPNIAGFIGSDHTAVLLTLTDTIARGTTLILDIGTNTEVSLINDSQISCVSCASGPAFEGGHIKHGMRAAEGAIERLKITDVSVKYQTIGSIPPIGICGSGLLDAVAQLYCGQVIDAGGKMQKNHPRVRVSNNQLEFILVTEDERDGKPAITITQKDVREVQLAKGAIRAGIQVLLENNRINEGKLDQVIIAGAFGTYLDINSAIMIGMIPSLPSGHYSQVGNAAGAGAKIALASIAKRKEAQAIASRTRYIELGSYTGFNELFINSTYLGSSPEQYKTRRL
jgi:uncharacterized 2Fe-2S/4Fe-4S cluster protein (DUF4445 family)